MMGCINSANNEAHIKKQQFRDSLETVTDVMDAYKDNMLTSYEAEILLAKLFYPVIEKPKGYLFTAFGVDFKL